jgi:hypothetical protein
VLNSILETCQLALGSHKKPRAPGEGKENPACRKAATSRRVDRRQRTGRATGSKFAEAIIPAPSKRVRTATSRSETTARYPRQRQPKDDRPAESPAHGRRPIRRLNGAEYNNRSESGGCLRRQARPSSAPDSDGANHGERLPPPFLGNTDVCKGKGHIIHGACSRYREQQPNDKTDDGERATATAYCPATSVKPPATKPTTMAPNGPAPV